ncbi:4-hydroxy-tetrahydrodipicolinate reductase [Kineococcus radiotolerans]|uniref:4-hydroxy-tetrahydrodipicolinate reductase n=1 Tax=Kineococcus radiotolerans (strain ATCC BAA-149 / DSM 14245 / SRS30216) TaxID=266940 RepID=A6W817_KINRD|nr:4-hydroxy-tetrahydrodipicolinate reductase [Kineococcus radiotolerans]ABS02956.1 Dihydrodipicolinate reductase [Kineococcus radiotolerans SRS30216 = ATCC BAA-149]
MTVRVAVAGARGRMGSQAVAAVEAAADLELVAALGRGDSLDAAAGADVLVDLTVPGSVMANVEGALARGLHVVTGTTGFTPERVAQVEGWAAAAGRNVLIATNFGIGAVLVMQLAAKAARFFESVEVVELHHPGKVDAPSGSAIRTAQLVAAARAEAGLGPSPDATETELPGARGAVVDGIHVHAVRMRGMTAHQEVILGGPGETLTLRDDTYDRSAYMPGLLLGVRQVAQRPGVTVGLEHYLDLD